MLVEAPKNIADIFIKHRLLMGGFAVALLVDRVCVGMNIEGPLLHHPPLRLLGAGDAITESC